VVFELIQNSSNFYLTLNSAQYFKVLHSIVIRVQYVSCTKLLYGFYPYLPTLAPTLCEAQLKHYQSY